MIEMAVLAMLLAAPAILMVIALVRLRHTRGRVARDLEGMRRRSEAMRAARAARRKAA